MNLAEESTDLIFRDSFKNTYLVLGSALVRSTLDHNGLGSFWYTASLVGEFRAQAYQHSWT